LEVELEAVPAVGNPLVLIGMAAAVEQVALDYPDGLELLI
jgi:hypothetical protein